MNAIIASVLSSSHSVRPPLIPRPDTLKGIDDLIRVGFEAYRGSCFSWLLAATGLVVVGLALEGPELWHDIASIVRHWRFKSRFRFSLPEEHVSTWAKLLAAIGWLLIVVGVAGEYVADSFVSKADGYVQTFDEILLTEAQRATSFARERASAAYERASDNEKETAETLKQAEQERTDAAKSLAAAETARKEAEGLQLQIAQANERAATAERETARLMEKLADRTLSPEQQKRIREKLTPFPGTPYELAVSDVPEATRLLTLIDKILDSAGWVCKPSEDKKLRVTLTLSNGHRAEIFHGSGVAIEITKSLLGKYETAGGVFQKALSAEGIEVEAHLLPDDNPSPNAIHIVVGTKE